MSDKHSTQLVQVQMTTFQMDILNNLLQAHIDIDKDQDHDEPRGPGYWEEVQNLADCTTTSNYNMSLPGESYSWVI